MKHCLIGAVMAAMACSSTPPAGSVARIKYDARQTLVSTCVKSPERYGFPNTRAENADLMSVAPGFAPNVYTYCRKVAQRRVR